MGDRLWAGNLSRYVTSHPGQLSLAIPLWVGEMSTSLGWQGNRRSGVALAMRQSIVVYPPTGLTAYESEMSTPPTLLRSMALLYLLLAQWITVKVNVRERIVLSEIHLRTTRRRLSMRSHSVICHAPDRGNRPAFTPTGQVGTRYSEG